MCCVISFAAAQSYSDVQGSYTRQQAGSDCHEQQFYAVLPFPLNHSAQSITRRGQCRKPRSRFWFLDIYIYIHIHIYIFFLGQYCKLCRVLHFVSPQCPWTGSVISMLVVGELILLTSDYHSIHHRRTAFAYGSLKLGLLQFISSGIPWYCIQVWSWRVFELRLFVRSVEKRPGIVLLGAYESRV